MSKTEALVSCNPNRCIPRNSADGYPQRYGWPDAQRQSFSEPRCGIFCCWGGGAYLLPLLLIILCVIISYDSLATLTGLKGLRYSSQLSQYPQHRLLLLLLPL